MNGAFIPWQHHYANISIPGIHINCLYAPSRQARGIMNSPVSTVSVLPFLLLFFFHVSSSDIIVSIIVNGSNPLQPSNTIIPETLPTYYSTIGNILSSPTTYDSLVILTKHNINERCEFNINITGHLVIMMDNIPWLYKCTNDPNGIFIAFARAAQNNGASGIIMKSPESVRIYSILTYLKYKSIKNIIWKIYILLFV